MTTARRSRRLPDALTLLVILAAAAVVGAQLFVRPIVGLADNGDFVKIAAPAGLRVTTRTYAESYWNYVNTRYTLVRAEPYPRGFVSSETLFVLLARRFAVLFRARFFDIRVLGAVHLAAYLAALGFLASNSRALEKVPRRIGAVLTLAFFTDVLYISAFQSLYMQTATFLFLLGTVSVVAGILGRDGPHPWLLGAYALLASLFVASKTQEAAASIILALLAAALARKATPGHAVAGGIAAAAAILATGVWVYAGNADDRRIALYQVVFTEILPHSPEPARDLARLGADPGLARCAGTNAYFAGTCLGDPTIGPGFFDRVSFGRLLGLYVSHPSRAGELVQRAAASMFVTPTELGHFERSSGEPPKAHSRHWSWWSRLRERATRNARLPAVLLVTGGTAAVAAATYRRSGPGGRLAREAVVALVLIACADFLVCALTNAQIELPRHLYGFDACFDLILVADAVWCASEIARRRRAARGAVPA